MKFRFYSIPIIPCLVIIGILGFILWHTESELQHLMDLTTAQGIHHDSSTTIGPNEAGLPVSSFNDAIRSRVFHAKKEMHLWTSASLVAALLMTALGILILRRKVYKPLAEVRAGVREVLGGHLEKRLHIKACREVAEVAEDFNRMTDQIEDRIMEIEAQGNSLQAVNAVLEQRLRETSTLFQISKILSLVTDTSTSLTIIVPMVKEALNLDIVSVLLVKENEEGAGPMMQVAAAAGFPDAEGNALLLKSDGTLPGEVLSSGASLFLEGVSEDPAEHLIRAENNRHFAGIPLIQAGAGFEPEGRKAMGMICVVRPGRPLPAETTEFLNTLAAYLTIYLQHAQLYNKMKRLSITDGLTGLYNHRYFKERLGTEVKRSLRYRHHVSLILLDVDHFKKFNDSNGHPMGDEVLRKLSRILQSSVRETDMVARYGGEEFVVLLIESDKASSAMVAERIRAAVEKADFEGGQNQPGGRVTVSVGVASLLEGAPGAEELVQQADNALYEAKHGGRNRVVTA